MNHWKTVKSIYTKYVAKCPEGTFMAAQVKLPQGFALRTYYGISVQKDGRKSICDRPVPITYNKAIITTIGLHVRFLNFNTEQERYNAWQSYLTKFARFCFIMDESMKLSPYMGNYTQPWDDHRFYEYFGLNKIEIQLIETVIK